LLAISVYGRKLSSRSTYQSGKPYLRTVSRSDLCHRLSLLSELSQDKHSKEQPSAAHYTRLTQNELVAQQSSCPD
jgi:hypothetical protein